MLSTQSQENEFSYWLIILPYKLQCLFLALTSRVNFKQILQLFISLKWSILLLWVQDKESHAKYCSQ